MNKHKIQQLGTLKKYRVCTLLNGREWDTHTSNLSLRQAKSLVKSLDKKEREKEKMFGHEWHDIED